MKYVARLVDIALALLLIVGSCWLVKTYYEATKYKTMNNTEKTILFVTDYNKFKSMRDSYEIVSTFLGE